MLSVTEPVELTTEIGLQCVSSVPHDFVTKRTNIMVAVGPARTRVRSTTLMPASGLSPTETESQRLPAPSTWVLERTTERIPIAPSMLIVERIEVGQVRRLTAY